MTDRGISVALNYVLGLAVATLLITGLLYTAGDIVEDRRESTTRGELRVVGERLASDLVTADSLAQTGAETVTVRGTGPDLVAGSDYTVSLNATSRELVLETVDPSIVVAVPIRNQTPVVTSTANGGDVEFDLNDDGELEVVSS